MVEFDTYTDTERAIEIDADFEARTSVLLLPQDEYVTGDYDASFSDIPAGRTLLELHLNFRHCGYMRDMSNVERGLQASILILKDWIALGEWTAERGYMPGESLGFVGKSPLARPRTLRQLGASIDPQLTQFTPEGFEILSTHSKETTGKPPTESPIRRFIISNKTLVANLPVAKAKLAKYQGWLHNGAF